MAGRTTRSTALASSLALLGCCFLTTTFVPLFRSSAASQKPHLANTVAGMPGTRLQHSPSLVGLVAAAGFAVMGIQVLSTARGKQVCCRAGESAVEAEAPPPPPPFDPAAQLGAMAPLGYFDPAGFSKTGDEEGFRNLRAAELKHGRVAMLASLGAVAQPFIKFPGFETVPSGIGAVSTPPGSYGFVVLFVLSGVLELAVWTQDPSKEAGDFGDPLGLGMYDMDMRSKELNNGRFAMFAAMGIIAAEALTGKGALQQLAL